MRYFWVSLRFPKLRVAGSNPVSRSSKPPSTSGNSSAMALTSRLTVSSASFPSSRFGLSFSAETLAFGTAFTFAEAGHTAAS